MKIFPAIDIKDKKCVRLIKGDFGNKTEYEMSPLDQAVKYKDQAKFTKAKFCITTNDLYKFLPNSCKPILVDNVLLFLDVVQCGFGRSGKLFSYQWSNIEPDVMAIAKGIGSGFPMGACLATKTASVGMKKGTHGSTFGGNPLAISVGKAALSEIMSDNFLKNVDDVARYLWKELKLSLIHI